MCQEELDLKILEPDTPSPAYQHLRDGILLERLGKLTNTLVTPRTSKGHLTKVCVVRIQGCDLAKVFIATSFLSWT